MGRLAVIASWHGRHENTAALLTRVSHESTRKPDRLYVVVEDDADYLNVLRETVENVANPASFMEITGLPTPRDANGRPTIIPYSYAHNYALDRADCDYIVYLDNGSMPHPDKFRIMVEALDEHPEWGAVYCGQHRTGYAEVTAYADQPLSDAYAKVNYTQVMHRRTDDRWPLDMGLANPDLADATFWRSLHASLGSFYPVGGTAILDEHHIPNEKAAGL